MGIYNPAAAIPVQILQGSGSITNSAVMTDTTITFPIQANEQWKFYGVISGTASTDTPGTVYQFIAPAGASGFIVASWFAAGSPSTALLACGSGGLSAPFIQISGAGSSSNSVHFSGYITNGATAGTAKLQIAQFAATPGETSGGNIAFCAMRK